MQRTPVAVVVLAACLIIGTLAAVGDEPVKSPVVHFRGGDFATGRLLDSDQPSSITWQAVNFDQPFQFPLSGVESVQFPLPAIRPTLRGPYRFELRGGGWLGGELVSLDKREAVLEIPGLGKLHVERAALLRFYRADSTDLIFAGPNGLEGWATSGSEKDWHNESGQLRTQQPGAAIGRDFPASPLTRYEFELSWQEAPNFELAVGRSKNPPDHAAFRIETWGDELVVTRESEKQADLAVLQKIGPGRGQVNLLVLFDQNKGQLLAFSAAGEKLADFTVPEDKPKASPPPKIIGGQRAVAPPKSKDKPPLPGGFQLINRRGDLKLQRLTINRWSGVAPKPAVAGQASIHLTDGAIESAEVSSFDAAARQLVVRKGDGERRFEERQLQDVVLSQPGETPAASVRVSLANGSRLGGELTKIRQDSVILQSPGIQEPLVLSLQDLQAVFFEKAGPPAEGAAPAGGDARLELTGVSMHGRLLDAAAAEHSCLNFKPRDSTVASTIAAGASGKLILREVPPPRPPNMTTTVTESPAQQMASSFQKFLGIKPNANLQPAPPGDCLLHLRSGDTIPCRVQFIDERGVTFKSNLTDTSLVPHKRIKALELRLDARPVKIEKAKFERLLTLPRIQRDNPPEQLIRSLEGDYLRGRLLAMNDKELQLEMRLEPKTIDRAQVTRILWLHPDEAAKATPAKPAEPATAEKLPIGKRIQAVPRSGNRLTFFAQQLSGETLSGQSEVLGACRVQLGQIDQLLIGDAIEEAAAQLAFHKWQLRPAPEPLPDPEPGSDPGSSGMESVLVGKSAPEIELDLLDGKKFRLADYKGKIVVLDFWASWCGPCLQAMPQVDTVAREFAGEGVKLVAINLEETPEQIKIALTRLKLETSIALDKDGRVAERYGATSIPQTVIIDGEGRIARLFVGGGARFDEQLRQALRTVLAGAKAPAPQK